MTHMRLVLLPICVLLTACSAMKAPVPTGQARYDSYPTTLIAAFRMACTGDADSLFERENGVLECRQFMPPEPTAATILYYDGTPEDLPQVVLQLQAIPDEAGFFVSNDVFLRVPQKSGQILKVPVSTNEVDRAFEKIYERTGGTVQPAPQI